MTDTRLSALAMALGGLVLVVVGALRHGTDAREAIQAGVTLLALLSPSPVSRPRAPDPPAAGPVPVEVADPPLPVTEVARRPLRAKEPTP